MSKETMSFKDLNHKMLFKLSIIYTVIMAFCMIIAILFLDYYEAGTNFSNYVFYSVGGTIILSSLLTTISGWKIHSKNERALLIGLHLSMMFVGICIILDQVVGPLWGVIGYSSMYLLIAIYWIAAMYFFGVIGHKYISEKKHNAMIETQQMKAIKKQKKLERKAAK